MPPIVSVLLCVHNDAAYIGAAVDSILSQTLQDFELIIVEDASTDETPSILKNYTDARIQLIQNKDNLGLTASLNVGLEHCTGTYIARMDSDDLSCPTRLEKQVRFLEKHPSIGLLGCDTIRLNQKDKPTFVKTYPRQDPALRWAMLWENPFVHSGVMIRRSMLLEHSLSYDEAYRTTQDYDLWTRLSQHTQMATYPEPLIRIRVHQNSITRQKRDIQMSYHKDIQVRYWQNFIISEIKDINAYENYQKIRSIFPYRIDIKSRLRGAALTFVRSKEELHLDSLLGLLYMSTGNIKGRIRALFFT